MLEYLSISFKVEKNYDIFQWHLPGTLRSISSLRKIFRGNLNEAISLAEIVSFRFPLKVFLKGKSRFREFETFPDKMYVK